MVSKFISLIHGNQVEKNREIQFYSLGHGESVGNDKGHLETTAPRPDNQDRYVSGNNTSTTFSNVLAGKTSPKV